MEGDVDPRSPPTKNAPNAAIVFHDISAPGAPEQFPPVGVIDGHKLTIRARLTNTDYVYLGMSLQDAQERHRIVMGPGDSLSYYVQNSKIFWGDCGVADEGFEITTEQP